MARRTKHESAQTRESILDAAEAEMLERGVTQTSLDRIARRAEVTRGAIYWHFEDKMAILEAMIRRTKLPLRDLRHCLSEHIPGADSDPVRLLREMMLHGIYRLAHDEQHRRVCHIVLHRCEMSNDTRATSRILDAMFDETRDVLTSLCDEISALGLLRPGLTVINVVDIISTMMAGLYQCSLRHPDSFNVDDNIERRLDAVLFGVFDIDLDDTAPRSRLCASAVTPESLASAPPEDHH